MQGGAHVVIEFLRSGLGLYPAHDHQSSFDTALRGILTATRILDREVSNTGEVEGIPREFQICQYELRLTKHYDLITLREQQGCQHFCSDIEIIKNTTPQITMTEKINWLNLSTILLQI